MKSALRLLSASWSLFAAYRNDFRKSLAIAENLTLGFSQDRVHFFVNDGSSRSDDGTCCCKVLDAYEDCESVGGHRFKSGGADGIFSKSEETWCCKKVVPPFSAQKLLNKMSQAKLSCNFKGNDYTTSLNKIRNPIRHSWWNEWSTVLLPQSASASQAKPEETLLSDLRNAVELIGSKASTGPNPGNDINHWVNPQTRQKSWQVSYLLTGRNEYCTSGFDITAASECELAAGVLGLQFGYAPEGIHKNCFYGKDTANEVKVFFNTAKNKPALDVSTLRTDYQSLCYEAHYVPPVIEVSNATGTSADIVNGVYDLSETFNEKPSWKKRGSSQYRLVWYKIRWVVTTTKQGKWTPTLPTYAYNFDATLPTRPRVWQVYNEASKKWETQTLVIQEVEGGEKLGAPLPSYSFSLTDCSATLNGQQVPSFGGMKWVQVQPFEGRSYNYKIPAVLAAMVSALRLKTKDQFPDTNPNGITRISGNQEEVDELQRKVIDGDIAIEDLLNAGTATIVSALKKRFLSMSKKLLDFVPAPSNSNSGSITSLILKPKKEVRKLVKGEACSMIERTPQPIRTVVLYWFDFLWQIVDGDNPEELESVAMIAAANLLSCPPDAITTLELTTFCEANKKIIVSALMLAHREPSCNL